PPTRWTSSPSQASRVQASLRQVQPLPPRQPDGGRSGYAHGVKWVIFLLGGLAAVVGCEDRTLWVSGRNPADGGGGNDAPDGADAGDAGSPGRVPKQHRASGLVCPTDRGFGSFTGCADLPSDPQNVLCEDDSACSDAAAGRNGRCSLP